jgi:hypothetical protein
MPFRKKHITELRSMIRINEPNGSEINQVIDLYQSRQIPRLDTAKLLIKQLQSRGKAKNKKAIDRLAYYTTNEPAVERRQRLVFERSILKSIDFLHDESARPVVKISLNTNVRLVPDEVLFELDIEGQHSKLFDATAFACEKTILNEILKQQSKYKNMKIMLGLNLDIYRVEIEDIENYRDRAKGELVDRKMTDEEILGFTPYKTLNYWAENVDIIITIENLPKLLNIFGYTYDNALFEPKNVSQKIRGKLNEENINRIKLLYNDDNLLYNKVLNSDL